MFKRLHACDPSRNAPVLNKPLLPTMNELASHSNGNAARSQRNPQSAIPGTVLGP